jgi:hypothetical protein
MKHTKLRIDRSLMELAFVTTRVNLDAQRATMLRKREEVA